MVGVRLDSLSEMKSRIFGVCSQVTCVRCLLLEFVVDRRWAWRELEWYSREGRYVLLRWTLWDDGCTRWVDRVCWTEWAVEMGEVRSDSGGWSEDLHSRAGGRICWL